MKNIIKVCCFAAILTTCICVSYKVLSFKDTMGIVGSSVTQLDYTEDNIIDAVFVGSSHVYAGISPATLWNEFGIAAFNMSVSGMDMDSAYYHLKHFLKTQSPKYVFVDAYSITFEEHMVLENVYRNMLSIPYSQNAFDLVDAYIGKENDARLDYILKWPIIHTRYKEVNYSDFIDLDFARYGRGEFFVLEKNQCINLENTYVTEVARLDEKRYKWLEDLRTLSVEKGFELIFCVVPYSVSYIDQTYLNAVNKFADENGIEYFDYNKVFDNIGLSSTEDCSDSLHLNTLGAEKLSRWIGTYLAYEKGIPTHQGEDGYDYWNQDYAYQAHSMSLNHLDLLYSLEAKEDFFRTLNGIPGISYVVSLDGENSDVYETYEDTLAILGIDKESALKGGVWFKQRGLPVVEIDCSAGKPFYADLDEVNSIKIYRDDKKETTEVYISNINGNTVKHGLTVIVYDNINHSYRNTYIWN